MFIEDESALKVWLIETLEPLCDAEPDALARYVLALVNKDKPLDKLRENCIDRLEVFLCQETTNFVDRLFDVICNRRYLSEGKKENVEPKISEPENPEPSNNEDSIVEEKNEPLESQPIPTTTNSRVHSLKRSNSNRNSNTTSDSKNSSNKRHLASSSPPAKRSHRSYSNSSGSSSPPYASSARHSNFSERRAFPCTDSVDQSSTSQNDSSYLETTGLSSNHDSNRGSYFTFDASTTDLDQQYNPEEPAFDYNVHKIPSMYQQRTLVTVITNPEPSSNEMKGRYRDHTPRNGSIRTVRTKRHVTTVPADQREHSNHNENRSRKRPWQKSNSSAVHSTTLEIRKIPVEFNTISKLNEHFSKFGIVTNVQIAYDGSSDSALIAYGTFEEAETAYKNPEPLFNNRFIKIFWHKGSNSTQNEVRPPKPAAPVVPHPAKLHWTKTPKPVTTPIEPLKKKSIAPIGPSSIKKEAAKKAAIEIRRKKTGLLDEQIQQQKLLLKKFESAETSEEKESIRALMKQVDATITVLKDSLRGAPVKTSTPTKMSEQDLLKHREKILRKKLEALRARTSADMRRGIVNTSPTTLTKENNEQKPTSTDEENRLLENNDVNPLLDPIVDEIQLLES